eukprot:gene19655-39085_t
MLGVYAGCAAGDAAELARIAAGEIRALAASVSETELARAKAQAVATRAPGSVVIGSDQVATLDRAQIGKPGNHANALAQLQTMRGRRVIFHTALCLWDSREGAALPEQSENVQVFVSFRDVPDAELDAYLHIEQPYDCAGSAKNEGLGIALLDRIDSSDPTALTGLPLIALTGMLRRAAAPGALTHVLPSQVQAITARLDYFVAENAKTARAFLKLVAIDHPLARPLQEIEIAELNVNTPAQALSGLLAPLLAGRDGGLVSEAGVPAVADPGADLVRLAHQHGITVRPLVGPSSLLLAVMASGLNGQSFAFNGYLPTDAAQRGK